MKILVDTNVLFSAVAYPASIPSRAVKRALTIARVVICQQNLDELRDAINRKMPRKLLDLELFLKNYLSQIEIIPMSKLENPLEAKIRDVNDRSILRAAIYAEVDIIITGDRDFLESGIESPRIITASDFLNL